MDTTSEWQPRQLGELIRLKKGVSYKGEFLDKPGPWLLGLGTIALGGGLMLDKARTYSGPIRNGQRAYPGDLLVAVVGITPEGSVIGSPAMIPPSAHGDFAITHHVARAEVISKDSVDVRFLYYLLRARVFADYVRGVQSGSTVPAVSIPDVLSYETALPPIAEQRTIARVLGSLDDKIELNRRMNQTLEDICRALFKFWFVDFGPVCAKAERRWKKGESLPGMPADMWNLWPSEFEESEMGEIPRGWKVVRLADKCSTQYGYTASAAKEVIGPHLVRVTDINKFPWIDWAAVPYCSIPAEENGKYSLRDGDIVVARMADPGKSAIVEGNPNAVFASYLVRLKVDSLARAYYTFYFLRSEFYLDYAAGSKSGSVQSNMNARVIVDAPYLDPPHRVLDEFLRRIHPLRRRIGSNLLEISILASARDTLLPKLLSGEVRVPLNNAQEENPA